MVHQRHLPAEAEEWTCGQTVRWHSRSPVLRTVHPTDRLPWLRWVPWLWAWRLRTEWPWVRIIIKDRLLTWWDLLGTDVILNTVRRTDPEEWWHAVLFQLLWPFHRCIEIWTDHWATVHRVCSSVPPECCWVWALVRHPVDRPERPFLVWVETIIGDLKPSMLALIAPPQWRISIFSSELQLFRIQVWCCYAFTLPICLLLFSPSIRHTLFILEKLPFEIDNRSNSGLCCVHECVNDARVVRQFFFQRFSPLLDSWSVLPWRCSSFLRIKWRAILFMFFLWTKIQVPT